MFGVLKEKLAGQIPGLREEIRNLVKQHGDKVISDVTIAQAYGGMRGVKAMICDTSFVDPEKGLFVRGTAIGDLADRIPEEIYWLLLTGELPNRTELASLQADLNDLSEVPKYVWQVLGSMAEDSHPMAMFNTAILAMERESDFRKRYRAGMKKEEYWDAALDDSLRLIAILPRIAAAVYRLRFEKGDRIPPNPDVDWAGNYAIMLGIPDPTGEFQNLMRLYLTLHCDHEGGNVSANTCHTVGSALSDPFYAVSAGLNGLAGPLHGLANQECLRFVLAIQQEFNGVPTDEQLIDYAWQRLNSGRVIPGYGHAVLRATDPRFTAFHAFGKRVCPDDEIFQIVDRLFAVIPDVLKEQGKAKNPYPNVDAGSGALLHHFGLREFDYYTVLFGVSRALGMSAQLVINRALGTPITRPKSVQTSWIKEQVGAA
jgi:citrate synthase